MRILTLLLLVLSLPTACSNTSTRARLDHSSALAEQRLEERVRSATQAYKDLLLASDGKIPEDLLVRSECIGVFPGILKAAFILGGKHGEGLVTCRSPSNGWSAPAFISFSGASIGWQIGAEQSNLILFFIGKAARQGLYRNNLTLGADIGITAGPIGRGASGQTDQSFTGIYAYESSSGLFAGISLEGSSIRPNREAISTYYGQKITSEELLTGTQRPWLPTEAGRFLAQLPR